jgi:hypothetical protein
VFEKSKIWEDGKVSLTEMDGDGDLENRIMVQMDKLNVEMIE